MSLDSMIDNMIALIPESREFMEEYRHYARRVFDEIQTLDKYGIGDGDITTLIFDSERKEKMEDIIIFASLHQKFSLLINTLTGDIGVAQVTSEGAEHLSGAMASLAFLYGYQTGLEAAQLPEWEL